MTAPRRTSVLIADDHPLYHEGVAGALGALDALDRYADAPALLQTIEAVARGETVIPSSMQAGLADQIRARELAVGEPALTPRELEVLRYTADGLSAPEIARELVLGVTTVKTHLHNIYGKLDVSDRAAAVAVAMRRGLLP